MCVFIFIFISDRLCAIVRDARQCKTAGRVTLETFAFLTCLHPLHRQKGPCAGIVMWSNWVVHTELPTAA